MNTPIFSIDNTHSLLNGDRSASSLLKAALLFYDDVALLGPTAWADDVVDLICGGSSLRHDMARAAVKGIQELGFDLEDFIYPQEILNFLAGYPITGTGLSAEALSGIVQAVKGDEATWSQELMFHPIIKLYVSLKCGRPYHGTRAEIDTLTRFFEHASLPPVSVSRELEISLPPIKDLPFDNVFALRSSPFRHEFRRFVHTHRIQQSTDDAIRGSIEEGLWQVIGQHQPSRNGSVWSRTMAAVPVPVPIPLPNPYGVYKEWQGGRKEKRLFQTHGWLWFIQEVRGTRGRLKESG